MKLRLAAAMITLAAPAFGQQMKPATDLSVHNEKLPGIEVRFVDWHWRPELFAAMEKSGSKVPEAQRNWGVLRLVNDGALTIEKTRLRAGNYGVALWPSKDGQGLSFEIREIDMRLVYAPDPFAPLPDGKTMWKGPANFETVSDTAERFVASLAEDAGKVNVTIRYGNRRAVLSFSR
jgi:hypothetical protein